MISAPRLCTTCGAEIPSDAPEGGCPCCLLHFGLLPDAQVAARDASTVIATKADEGGSAENVEANATAAARQGEDAARSTEILGELGDYELLEVVGRGGQGVVYRAHQKSLNRTVALKMISLGSWATEAHLKRFRREAEAAARLEHPGIVPIHEVGERDGSCYFSMRFVEGGQLDQVIKREPMSIRQAAELISKVARTVHYAHEHGILHRDIKPGNILLDAKGEPLLTDFGLARLVEAESTVTRTKEVMGTPSYMAPEQAMGNNAAVSSATDVYGLGAVLYHLLTGHPSFAGGTTYETIKLVLDTEPRQPRSLNPKVDRDLSTICLKCLEKDPKSRYGSALALAEDLEHWLKHEPILARRTGIFTRGKKWVRRNPAIAALTASLIAVAAITSWDAWQRELIRAAPEKSIAVLPFVNMSDDKANDYFSDGISEELLNLLAKIPQLKVTARMSSFSFKGKELDIPEIARRLHVAHVLEGSVRKAGDQVRITAQLIHAADGFHMWSETYDRKLDDIFKIQDEVAGKVVKELKVTLLEPQPKARTTDPKAYALYLQASQLGRQKTAKALEKSDALYHQALEIDPRYTPAWNNLAVNFTNKAFIGMVSSQEGFARSREAVEQALAIDPDYAPAHAQLGYIALYDNDEVAAAAHYERALALDPTDLGVLGKASMFLVNLGRLDEALALKEATVRRDPVNTTPLFGLGYAQRLSGRYDEAIASYRTALSLNPGLGVAHSDLGVALLLKGDAAGALAEIEQEPNESWRMLGLPMAYHALGRKADCDTALAALITKYERDSPYQIAYVYAFRGEADQAFAWLDKAIEYHDAGLSEIVVENLFDKIHSDPRWLPFLRKIGKAPDQLAKIKFKVTLPPQ
jgi:TolB-like protein/Tfp pilus assembly protein PilF/predicted Ser/Thr protein kinase